MKKLAFFIVLILSSVTTPAVFASPNPCLSLTTSPYTYLNFGAAFQGNNGTLNQLGGLSLWIGPDQNANTFSGDLEYYGGAFGSNVTGTCTDNKNGTAAVSLSALYGNIGSLNGVLVITPAGPNLEVTHTSLLNHDGNYSNVNGNMILSPVTESRKSISK